MWQMIRLAWQSLVNRKATALLTITCIALSVLLLLGVERIRVEAKNSFTNTISGTDLIVGARSGSIQLLLYSVFRIGNPTNNISWQSYQELAQHDLVKWTIPMSLGDSHQGYRVLGTNQDYFRYYKYARDKTLELAQGQPFTQLYDAVLGAEVAKQLEYEIGQQIIIAHGAGKVSFIEHGDKPFTVVGILKPTGTPIDKTVHVSLEAIEAIHIDWQGGGKIPGLSISAKQASKLDLTPKTITAFMLGLESRISTFKMQRHINEYRQEALLAIIPGVALQELWDLMSVAEQALLMISMFVVAVGLIGMLTMILASINERRREMAILRSVGAKPRHVFTLLVSEAGLLALLGVVVGVVLFYISLFFGAQYFAEQYGLRLGMQMLTAYEMRIVSLIIVAALFLGVLPAYRVYRASLTDGITIRV